MVNFYNVPKERVPLKKDLNARFLSLKTEYQHYGSAFKDLSDYLNPTRGLFTTTQVRGTMIDHKKLLDSYATNSIRKTASGLNSGITSKSRPWFRLILSDEDTMQSHQARVWLDEVQKRMYTILEGSNIYGTFQNVYEELLTFGTGCFILLEDYEKVIRTRNYTIGEYYLAVSKTGKVNTFAREFKMTVAQVVDQFGLDKCSAQLQMLYKSKKLDDEALIKHIIEPNLNRDMTKEDSLNMSWRSVYWEDGKDSDDVLDIRGFRRFPVIAPRWSIPSTDVVYGFCPGWDALGDVKELQKIKYDKLMAQEKLHNPPLQADAHVEGHVNKLPGGVTKTSSQVPNTGVRPSYQVNPNLESFIELINDCRQAIDRHFYTDLFTMLAVLDRGQMTAREVAAREQERIMLMGPILNQLDEEMLSNVIEIVFGIMIDNGLIPPPPEEIQGQEIKVQYISILAQMQRSIGSAVIEKVIGYATAMGGISPQVPDVVNWDESLREIMRNEGAPAKTINRPEVVNQIREERARQANLMASMQGANSAADTAKKLSETKTNEQNALTGIMAGLNR